MIHFYEEADARVIVLSEYGIRDVSQPVHINRVLRESGLLACPRSSSDASCSTPAPARAFAVADHQVAHVYVNDRAKLQAVRELSKSTAGIEQVLDADGKRAFGIDHARSGDLVAIAAPNAWFTYYYWLEDDRAPDFARTVDIHRKPGYDPVELFLDPALRLPALTVAWKLARKQLGFRTLLDVIPIDATLVKGSHGRRPADEDDDAPVFITRCAELMPSRTIESVDVHGLILRHLAD